MKKLVLIAGNRDLPLVFCRSAKKNKDLKIIGICFRGETNPGIIKFIDKAYWIEVGKFAKLIRILKNEDIKDCIMLGQISPRRIFNRKNWDTLLLDLVKESDFKPHSIFAKIILSLEKEGFRFLNSTLYMEEHLAQRGLMNQIVLDKKTEMDIKFGLELISRYVELDVGQTVVVKSKAPLALESLEGTDNTIRRAAKIGGEGCVVLKFSKKDQDLRFDVPVVGLSTLKLLKKIKAKALVLEEKRVIMIDKEKFLARADEWKIAIIGKQPIAHSN